MQGTSEAQPLPRPLGASPLVVAATMDDSDGEVDVGVGSGSAGDKGVVMAGGMCAWQVGPLACSCVCLGRRSW